MADRDWAKELDKIDKHINAMPADAPPARGSASAPPAATPAKEAPRATHAFGVYARLGLAVLLGVAIILWPYEAKCGAGLAAYLAAIVVVVSGGVWASIWTWRHRAARAHTLSLLIVLWGLVLGALDVLPRIGYAKPTPQHPAVWACK